MLGAKSAPSRKSNGWWAAVLASLIKTLRRGGGYAKHRFNGCYNFAPLVSCQSILQSSRLDPSTGIYRIHDKGSSNKGRHVCTSLSFSRSNRCSVRGHGRSQVRGVWGQPTFNFRLQLAAINLHLAHGYRRKCRRTNFWVGIHPISLSIISST